MRGSYHTDNALLQELCQCGRRSRPTRWAVLEGLCIFVPEAAVAVTTEHTSELPGGGGAKLCDFFSSRIRCSGTDSSCMRHTALHGLEAHSGAQVHHPAVGISVVRLFGLPAANCAAGWFLKLEQIWECFRSKLTITICWTCAAPSLRVCKHKLWKEHHLQMSFCDRMMAGR